MPVEFLEESETFKKNDEGVYPDNAQAVAIFIDISTQWRVGGGGACGLDYNVLDFVFNLRRVKNKNREDVFDCIRVMEKAALEIFSEKAS